MSRIVRNRHFAYEKTKTQISFAVTAKLINAFVFATRIVQFLYYLNPKFQASSHLLWLYSPVCVGPGGKPRSPVFSERGSNISLASSFWDKSKQLVQIEKLKYAESHLSLVLRKPVLGVSDHTNQAVQPHKMARGLKFWI